MKLPGWINWSIRILLSAAFVLSGILKLYPIEFFENDLLIHHLSTENLVLFQSRLLIGGELMIAAGILLALADRIFLFLSLLMLGVYTLYLVILLIVEGNSGNCGCFGSAFIMTPLEGIIKNIFLGGMTAMLWSNQIQYNFRFKKVISIVIVLFTLALPFILNPIFFAKKVETLEGEKIILPFEVLYESEGEQPPSFEVRQGKQVVCFMLLGCGHCRLAATRLESIKREHPELPIYFVLNGEEKDLESFKKETHLRDVPYHVFGSLNKLLRLSGADFPAIYLVEDSQLEISMDYYDIRTETILEWYKN